MTRPVISGIAPFFVARNAAAAVHRDKFVSYMSSGRGRAAGYLVARLLVNWDFVAPGSGT